jgi:hypothetical protein
MHVAWAVPVLRPVHNLGKYADFVTVVFLYDLKQQDGGQAKILFLCLIVISD